MEPSEQPIRIVKYPGGEELTLEQAASESYVFAAGPDPDTLFAFDSESAHQDQESWAAEQGLSAQLEAARRVIDALPGDPGTEYEEATERAEVEQINSQLDELSAKIDMPIGAPGFLAKAHEAAIFDSAILYGHLNYVAPPRAGLNASCADVTPYLPAGALSVRTSGYNVVLLFDQRNYGSSAPGGIPMVTLVGTDCVPMTPRPVRSVRFSS
jgi:hypothetical protein